MGVARYRGNTGALKFCGLHAGVARGGRRARLALRANRGSFDRSRRRDSKLNHHDPRLTRAVRSSIADASHELGELWHRLGRALGVHHLGHDDRHQIHFKSSLQTSEHNSANDEFLQQQEHQQCREGSQT